MDLNDLARVMTADETEKVSSYANSMTPEAILSDADLERIMDRRPEAYESGDKEGDKFKILEEEEDETNNCLIEK